jgi:hypothetical protein
VFKSTIRQWLDRAGTNSAVWSVYRGLNSVGRLLSKSLGYAYASSAAARLAAEDSKLAAQISPALTVLSGPFQGMRYPHAQSAGSALIPKLLGSYERELHPAIEGLARQEFSCVVDVGCAEGYYAVGFAMRLPKVAVYAFDTNPTARRLCLAMAQLNGVSDRVRVSGFCDEQALLGLPLGPKALVISDCEGYEITLFSARVAQALAQHTLLIEIHDYLDEDLGDTLKRRFEATHHLQIFESIDDRRKVSGYENPALAPYDTSMRRRLLTERRAWIMQWFLLTPRTPARSAAPGVSRGL